MCARKSVSSTTVLVSPLHRSKDIWLMRIAQKIPSSLVDSDAANRSRIASSDQAAVDLLYDMTLSM